jgi:hypothetical protein
MNYFCEKNSLVNLSANIWTQGGKLCEWEMLSSILPKYFGKMHFNKIHLHTYIRIRLPSKI